MEKIKAEIRKMREMKPGEALDYFWTYYKLHLLFAAILIFFLVGVLQAAFGKKQETVFAALLVDTGVSQEAADSAAADFAAFLELDPETQRVTLDTSLTLAGGNVVSIQRLMVSVAAGELDAVLSNADATDYLLKSGDLADLREILPEETLSRCAGKLFYTDPEALSAWVEANRAGEAEDAVLLSKDPSGMANPAPVGIDVTEACAAAFDRPADYGEVIFTVAVTTGRQEEAAKFLDYLERPGGSGA